MSLSLNISRVIGTIFSRALNALESRLGSKQFVAIAPRRRPRVTTQTEMILLHPWIPRVSEAATQAKKSSNSILCVGVACFNVTTEARQLSFMLTDQIEFVDTNQSIATSSPTPILGDVDAYENEIHSAFTDHPDREKRALVDGESPDSKRLRLTVLPVDYGTRKISSASYTKAVHVLWKWLAPRCFSANRGEALTEAIEPMKVVDTPASGATSSW